MEYVIGAVILVAIVYILTRKKKEKSPIEKPIEEKKEEPKDIVVKPFPIEQKVYWFKDGKKEWGRMKYMPQGLQVFDEKGQCVLDVTDRLTRVLGTFSTGNNYDDTEYTNELLKQAHKLNQKIWCLPIEMKFPIKVSTQQFCFPTLTIKNGVITIHRLRGIETPDAPVEVTFMYGSM